MKCPFCSNADTQVTDTRVSEDGFTIRRRRRCYACEKRFTTYERMELSMPVVVKRDGSRMEFDVDKLKSSMRLALRKRPVPAEKLDEAVSRIQDRLANSQSKEIHTEQIGQHVMQELRQLDQVAYVRFASVYQSFEDIQQFVQAIQEIQTP
ncbi:transcriptional regulator NrdR [Pelistega suis]|uniref:Transcriptional repressor NrdR n=1 Tax=Pelistega suis TaxID=1631957 RepID=A0A849P4Z0_9BURK|nr:transcriptional regulator NrdR [Pelistega suis]MCQ9328012.1 transcriptional regulator NrdR [Pelistega suis]NOL50795.1 transcriptional repressor NrdR [Pelistega suis]